VEVKLQQFCNVEVYLSRDFTNIRFPLVIGVIVFTELLSFSGL